MKKTEKWRLIVGIIAMISIAMMWVNKGMISIESLPLLITTLAVSLVKIIVFALGIYVIKHFLTKLKK